ncbi:MAG: MoaD/ThiS family protein [Actinomycetota bacterium]
MKITVKVIGGLVHRLGFGEQEREVPAGTTAGGLLAELGIPDARTVITTRNGWGIAPNEMIAEGDRILVSPPFSGG